MITITAVIDDDGVLTACRAAGHAGAAARGNDIVCAAVSVLMRSMARVVHNRAGIRALFVLPERGCFEFSAEYDAEGKGFLFAAGSFLLEGLKSVAEEFPEFCSIIITNKP